MHLTHLLLLLLLEQELLLLLLIGRCGADYIHVVGRVDATSERIAVQALQFALEVLFLHVELVELLFGDLLVERLLVRLLVQHGHVEADVFHIAVRVAGRRQIARVVIGRVAQ